MKKFIKDKKELIVLVIYCCLSFILIFFHENWRDELNNKLNSFLLSKRDVFLEDDDVVIKYDIHRSKRNEREWNEMIDNDEITLSIDCYRFGLLFKMKRKEKQHFILKF